MIKLCLQNMEPAKVLESNTVELLTLPVHQTDFIAALKEQHLLHGDMEIRIKAKPEQEAAQILMADIQKSLVITRDSFDKLIWVMKQYKKGGMEQLANKMESVAKPKTAAGSYA